MTISILDKPKIPFDNTIHYEKLNSLWTVHILEMHYFHDLKTMTFNCQVADIAFFCLAVMEIIQSFLLSVTSDTCSKTRRSQTFFMQGN